VDYQSLRGKFLLSLLLGFLVFAGLTFYADFDDLKSSFQEFNWALLPLILVLTTGNYAFRFVKWQYYLRLIGVRGLPARDSFLIFFSGMGMVITPGKVGEWLKSYLLREVHGTPIARSAPILIAERLTDSIALLIIASAGVFVFNDMWQVFVIVAFGCALIIAVAQHRPTAQALMRLGARVPVLGRFVPQMEEFYESTRALLAPTPIILMSLLSATSWFFEVLGFYFTFIGLGLDHSGSLLLHSAFILPIATLASAILLTPGGLGVAEASITGLSQALLDVTRSEAALATLVIRFGTLWFGVIIGLGCFAVLTRRLARQDARPETQDLSVDEMAARSAGIELPPKLDTPSAHEP
jgi:glycosyltransferase 2 family protein